MIPGTPRTDAASDPPGAAARLAAIDDWLRRHPAPAERALRRLLDDLLLQPQIRRVSYGYVVTTGRGRFWLEAAWPALRRAIVLLEPVSFGPYFDDGRVLLGEGHRVMTLADYGWDVLTLTADDMADAPPLAEKIIHFLEV